MIHRRLSRSLIRQNIPNPNNITMTTERPYMQRRRTTSEDMNALDEYTDERGIYQDTEVLFGREGRDMSVAMIGALLWPTISSIVGRCVYNCIFRIETDINEVS